MQPIQVNPDPSSTGLDPKVAGLLCYLFGFITGIVFLMLEKKSRFVKFHALQSIVISVVLIVASLILGSLPLIGWLFALILSPLSFLLWIALMLLALQGRMYKLPLIGDWIEKQGSSF
ncbi:DUF4870 domain-containing protein [Paenibacillus sp. PL2-23]|uniref:DUF4870 domain-containing protein n=1 Tax=Paenibacillus sp. PL2-23 TaxID=2100729 RepID=UPI0030FA170B